MKAGQGRVGIPAAVQRFFERRFTSLTIALIGLSIVANAIRPGDVHTIIVDAGFSLLLLFAIRTVGRGLRVTAIVLAVPAVLGHWSLYFAEPLVPRALVFLLSVICMGFFTLVIVTAVLRDHEVTVDTMVGGVCAYFLLSITWGNAYSLVELLEPGSFVLSPALAAEVGWRPPTSPINPVLQYYSLTTLTTLGFGDITPLSRGARTLSVLEGVSGQLYLAVLIARLVGIHTARSTSS
jgi:voltage-gated potassium channel